MRSATFILAAAALLAPAAIVGAQTATPLPGARVRLTTPSLPHARQVGTLVAVQADTIYLRREGQPDSLAVPLTQVTAIEVSDGSRTYGRRGLGIGFLAGASMGAVIGLSDGDDWLFTAEAKALIAGTVFGVGGAIVGGLVGLASKTEKWRSVPVAGSTGRLGVSPRGGGVALSLRF